MKRGLLVVGLSVSLSVLGYGTFLQLRGDPTLKAAHTAQAALSLKLDVVSALEAAGLKQQTAAARRKLEKRQARLTAIANYERSLKIGQPVGRIVIRRLGVKAVFIEGAPEKQDALETELLKQGPTHYRSDYGPLPLPGMGRTVAIAGHRTTYGAWFRHIDELEPGDRIVLLMPYGAFRYRVQTHKQVAYNAWNVLNDHGYERLVLTSCDPPGSAARRLAVFAKLVP